MSDFKEVNCNIYDGNEGRSENYNNSQPLNFHLYTDDERGEKAINYLCDEIQYTGQRAKTHMMVVILNVFDTYLTDPERWIGCSRDRRNYGLPFRYNKRRIGYDPMLKVVDGLVASDYLEQKEGKYLGGGKKGWCSRIRATPKLLELLEQFNFSEDMVLDDRSEEVIVLKAPKVNDATKVMDYEDTKDTDRMRKVVNKYNDYLRETYIDLDHQDYRLREPHSGTCRDYTLYINLRKKKVRRIFNDGSFSKGGRFYGGWWMGIPGDLRLRIIINNHKVAELDYSGIHIHLLYAMEGIDYGREGEDPYSLPDYPEDPKMRNLFKVLLLAAINANNEKDAVAALREKIYLNKKDFPEDIPDLKKVIQDFKEHHKPIAKYLTTGAGLSLMNLDSKIAEEVIFTMTAENVPVLPVHDSFICPKIKANRVRDVMLKAYRKHIPKKNREKFKPTIKIKYEEMDQRGRDEEYMYDILNVTDEALVRRMIHYDQKGTPLTPREAIKIPGKNENCGEQS